MEGISDIRVCGMDPKRPPRIQKEPYINLYFTLNHKAPDDWCSAFNDLMSHGEFSVKIEPDEGLYIETWVRLPDEIEPALDGIKEAVTRCSEEYVTRVNLAAATAAQNGSKEKEELSEQGRLNRIVAGLKFDD